MQANTDGDIQSDFLKISEKISNTEKILYFLPIIRNVLLTLQREIWKQRFFFLFYNI